MKVFLPLLIGIIMITSSTFATAPKVLIIGGGPSGLTTAKALENAGLTPTIVEKRKAYATEGAGIAIPANGSWALEKLGIPLEDDALKITQMTFTDDQGEILTTEDLTNIHPDGNQFYAIDRTKLNQLLSNSLTQTEVRMGISVTMISEQKDNIRVMFSDGTSDNFDYVIIADGMHSHTRALLDPNYSANFGDTNYGAQYLGIQMWRTIIKNPTALKNPVFMLGGDTLILIYPINDGDAYIYMHEVKAQTAMTPDEDQLTQKFSQFGGEVPKILAQIQTESPRILSHYLETSHDTIWHKGPRILFVGDASRGFSPMLQNGAAQAFEDAYVLGELFKSKDLDDLAAAYQARREDRAQWVKDASDKRIVALGQEDVLKRNTAIRTNGAPNVAGFKALMQNNP